MAARKTGSKPGSRSASKPSGSKSGGPKASSAKAAAAKPSPVKASAEKAATSKESAAKAGASKGSVKPPPDLAARIDGLRGWLDQIEHKQGRMTLFGGLGLLLALAAAGAALYFGITTHNDAATKSDVARLGAQIGTLKSELDQATQGKQSTQQTLSSLQQQVQSLQTKQQQQAQEISALRSAGAASNLTTPGTKAPSVTKKKP